MSVGDVVDFRLRRYACGSIGVDEGRKRDNVLGFVRDFYLVVVVVVPAMVLTALLLLERVLQEAGVPALG